MHAVKQGRKGRPAQRRDRWLARLKWLGSKTLKVGIYLLALAVVIFGAAMLHVVVTGQVDETPIEAYWSGDLETLAGGWRKTVPPSTSESPEDPFYVPPTLYVDPNALRRPPIALQDVAVEFTDEVNRQSPGSVIHAQVDDLGHLYLVPGSWFYTLTADEVSRATTMWAVLWRQTLFDRFGDWSEGDMSQDAFAPGIIFFDCIGEVSRDLNGIVRVLRLPDPCQA